VDAKWGKEYLPNRRRLKKSSVSTFVNENKRRDKRGEGPFKQGQPEGKVSG